MMETTNRDAKDLIAELCEVAAGAHRLSAKFAGRIHDLEKAGATPEQIAAVTRQYRYMMVGLVRTRAMPDESFLIAETIVRLRLDKRQFVILKLPNPFIEKLCRRILKGGGDGQEIHEWMVAQLRKEGFVNQCNAKEISQRTMYRFIETFNRYYLELRDRFIGFGVDQLGCRHGLLATDGERPIVALPPHDVRPEDEKLLKAALRQLKLTGLRIDLGPNEVEAVARLILGLPLPHYDVRIWLMRQTGDPSLSVATAHAIIERFAVAFEQVGGRSLAAEWHAIWMERQRQNGESGEDTNDTPETEGA